jgi:hypothetical protein
MIPAFVKQPGFNCDWHISCFHPRFQVLHVLHTFAFAQFLFPTHGAGRARLAQLLLKAEERDPAAAKSADFPNPNAYPAAPPRLGQVSMI